MVMANGRVSASQAASQHPANNPEYGLVSMLPLASTVTCLPFGKGANPMPSPVNAREHGPQHQAHRVPAVVLGIVTTNGQRTQPGIQRHPQSIGSFPQLIGKGILPKLPDAPIICNIISGQLPQHIEKWA